MWPGPGSIIEESMGCSAVLQGVEARCIGLTGWPSAEAKRVFCTYKTHLFGMRIPGIWQVLYIHVYTCTSLSQLLVSVTI